MADMLGVAGLLFALLVPLIVLRPGRRLALILCVAWMARTSAALVHYYLTPLPDGSGDAVVFERYAWLWSQDGFFAALTHYPGAQSHFYPWVMSLVYAVTGRSELLLQSLSVMAGVFGVYTVWRLSHDIWSDLPARKAAWVMALFPTVVMYSSLTLRESYSVLFLLLGLVGVARWARRHDMTSVLAAIAAFVVGGFFHGGIFLACFLFLGVIVAQAAKEELAPLLRGYVRPTAALAFLSSAMLLTAYAVSDVSIHKLGTAGELFSPARWLHFFDSRTYGAAAYPEWTLPTSAADLIWAVPLRAVYLLFSPFPWDVESPGHLIGLFDGLLYLGLVVVAWRHRRALLANSSARAVGLVVIGLVFAFGVGSGNFGTGLRHRAKLVGALVALTSPWLPRLVVGRARGR